MIKRGILFFICILYVAKIFAASALREEYEKFLQMNDMYVSPEEAFLAKVRMKGGKEGEERAYCLSHPKGQCVEIKQKSGMQYFFRTDGGYFLFNGKLHAPLKISSSYKISDIEVQDIINIDFRKNYSLASEEDEKLLLERKGGSSYKFIVFQKIGEALSLSFLDGKKTPLKRISYYIGEVDGKKCFSRFDIEDLLFKDKAEVSWIIEGLKPVSVPSSLFSLSNIRELTERLHDMAGKL